MGMEMQSSLATPADAEMIRRLYELRREEVMRKARAWVIGEFWPASADDYFGHRQRRRPAQSLASAGGFLLGDGRVHGAARRGFRRALVDCNAEGFYLLAKFAPFLDAIRERFPTFLVRTTDLVKLFPPPLSAMRWC